jgi:hypothetical protein
VAAEVLAIGGRRGIVSRFDESEIISWKIGLAYLHIFSFQLHILWKSFGQVLTPVNNFQLLLKLEILDKLRLETFHKWQHKVQRWNWFILVHTSSRETGVLMTLTHKVPKIKMLIAKCSPFLWCQQALTFYCYFVNQYHYHNKRKSDFNRFDYFGWINNTSFSSLLMNGPNKLEHYITIAWNGWPETNTSFWVHSQVQKN